MTNSQNGWSVIHDPDDLHESTIHGVQFPNGVRPGDVQVVLDWVMDQLHHRVEPLRAGWCWGWFVKEIEGSDSISNHSSGTAYDFNAPDHPLGATGTFSSAQVTEIHRILGEVGNVVRWGGDYSGRKDPMHFEIHANSAAVKEQADRIREDFPVDQKQFNSMYLSALNDETIAARVKTLAGQGVHNQRLGSGDETIGQDLQGDDNAEILAAVSASEQRILSALAAIPPAAG